MPTCTDAWAYTQSISYAHLHEGHCQICRPELGPFWAVCIIFVLWALLFSVICSGFLTPFCLCAM